MGQSALTSVKIKIQDTENFGLSENRAGNRVGNICMTFTACMSLGRSSEVRRGMFLDNINEALGHRVPGQTDIIYDVIT